MSQTPTWYHHVLFYAYYALALTNAPVPSLAVVFAGLLGRFRAASMVEEGQNGSSCGTAVLVVRSLGRRIHT